MKAKTLDGLRVAILATDGVEESELTEPRRALEAAGATTVLIAPKAGRIQAMKHDEKADRFPVDATLDEIDADDFDAVMLPGGAFSSDKLRIEPHAKKLVRSMDEAGKPIAAICHAPWLLVSAELTKGRTLTSYHTIQDDIRNAGGRWVDEPVVRDGNWVTSRKPADLPAFNRQMIELFAERKARPSRPKPRQPEEVAPPVGR
jgi:protease I